MAHHRHLRHRPRRELVSQDDWPHSATPEEWAAFKRGRDTQRGSIKRLARDFTTLHQAMLRIEETHSENLMAGRIARVALKSVKPEVRAT